jgi:molybdenum cofactor guanylyltransferase
LGNVTEAIDYMRVLGAILAGGKATRFGSDKAVAVLAGRPLIEHVASALMAQCDELIVVGRTQNGYHCVDDRPSPDMGPLAGLAGALAYASNSGFTHVLSVGVDAPGISGDLRAMLGAAPAYVVNQPVIGYWPVGALALLDDILASNERHSMRHFTERLGARGVTLENPPVNINTTADLEDLVHKT